MGPRGPVRHLSSQSAADCNEPIKPFKGHPGVLTRTELDYELWHKRFGRFGDVVRNKLSVL